MKDSFHCPNENVLLYIYDEEISIYIDKINYVIKDNINLFIRCQKVLSFTEKIDIMDFVNLNNYTKPPSFLKNEFLELLEKHLLFA